MLGRRHKQSNATGHLALGILIGILLFVTLPYWDDAECWLRSVLKKDSSYEALFPRREGSLRIYPGWSNFFSSGRYMVISSDHPIQARTSIEETIEVDWKVSQEINERELRLVDSRQQHWIETFLKCPMVEQKPAMIISYTPFDDLDHGDHQQHLISNMSKTLYCLIDGWG